MGRKYIDLSGKRFGNVTVVSVVEESGGCGRRKRWNCLCDCGKTFTAESGHLIAGKTTRCRKCAYEKSTITKHGFSGDPLYSRWIGMRFRCYSVNSTSYKNYGGRGITMCDEWGGGELDISGFLNFKKWSEENGFSPELEIDRIDVDGPYSPQNCRWVSEKEQKLNKTNTATLTLDGVTKPLMEWASDYGIKADTLRKRIRRGMDVKSALHIKE